MPQFQEVLNVFNSHFNYLNKQSNQRQSAWYAFWYKALF